MPRKKTKSAAAKVTSRAKGPKVTKAAFVRSLPHSMPAKDVVAKAKAAGFSLSTKHVYVIRSEANKKNGKSATQARGREPKVSPAAGGSVETNFRKLLLAIGIAKSKSLLADVEHRLGALLSGR